MPQLDSLTKQFASCPILIVDDEQLLRLMISSLLETAGFNKFEFAENGAEALEKIASFQPICVIMDINMPVMNGREALTKIRSEEKTKELPVLVVTGHDDRDERNEILRSGASNIISKPIDGDILIERVTNLVERKLLSDQLSEFHNRLTMELSMASGMQVEAVPSSDRIREIEEQYGVQIAAQFKPSSELGGDYWALQTIDQSRFGVLLVDFCGHGISAALNTFRLDMLISRLGVCETTPAEYMATISAELSEVLPSGQFCTMIYAIFDVKKKSLTYSGAAAPSPIIGSVNTGSVDVLDGSGLPIGITKNAKYNNNVVDFPNGSFFFIFSDALFETELGKDGVLEIEGVVALAEKYRSENAINSLNDVLSDFMKNAPDPIPDDLTTIWVSY